MKKRTKQQSSLMFSLIRRLSINEETRKEMIFQRFGKTSSKDLSHKEAQDFIDELHRLINTNSRVKDDLKQKLRRDVFRLMYDCGLLYSDQGTSEKVAQINFFIERRTKLGRTLNQLTIDELNSFIKQLQAIRRNYKQREEVASELN